jgi:membrane-associated phospholipid phosphatase
VLHPERVADLSSERMRPLLPRSCRRAAVVTVVLSAAITVGLGVRYRSGIGAGHLDRFIDAGLLDRGDVRVLGQLASLGDPVPVAAAAGLVAIGAVAVRRWSAVALAMIGPSLAAMVTELVLKPLVGRRYEGELAFPSGHTTGVVAVAVVIAVILADARWPPRAAVRRGLAVAAAVPAVASMAALVALRRHYATDTIGGAAVAVAVVTTLAFGLDWAAQLTAAHRATRGATHAGERKPGMPDPDRS